jgi:hypothetical protein
MSALDNMDRTRVHDITVDEVKSCALFAHLTDEEAKEVVETIQRFSLIIFHCYSREKVKKAL